MPAPIAGVIAHTGKPQAAELGAKLVADLASRGAEVHLETATAKLLRQGEGRSVAELADFCDILLVLGGDGTILNVAHDLGERTRPIFGINLGSLGFLTCVSSSAYAEAVGAVMERTYIVDARTLLSVEVLRHGETVAVRTGLNDAVASRGELSRLIKLHVSVNGVFLSDYNADGLIIATPTGSTAYSLAAGGPILAPGSGVFVITPICPHVLTNRSVILSDTSTIEIEPCEGQREVFLTVDGQELLKITEGDTIRIRKAAYPLKLAMLPDVSFFQVLRQKLKWSGSAI